MIPRLAMVLALLFAALTPGCATAHALEPGFLALQPLGGRDGRVT